MKRGIRRGVDGLETNEYYRKLLNMAVTAGSIMISSGAETHRVEDTLHRILGTTHFEHADAVVFTTGMVVTLSDPSGETLSISRRVTDCSQNFGKIAEVNSVSRDFCNGKITLDEAIEKLEWIKAKKRYNSFLQYLGYILASCGFTVMFGGEALDALGTIFCGLILSIVELELGPKIKRGFVTTILAAAMMTITATAVSYIGYHGLGISFQTHYMIIGGMMPLVPGLAMTTAFRDILQGDYLSAGSRILEALMVAVCVAIGIGAGMSCSDMLGLSETLTLSFNLSVTNVPEFLFAAFSAGVAIIGFYLLFDTPKKYFFVCGLNAAFAWSVYLITDSCGLNGLWASFFSTLAADFFAYYSARILKAPMILFLVAGILPMVPGISIYQGVYSFMFGIGNASEILTGAFMTTGVIALAIFLMDTVLDMEKRIRAHILKKRKS
ncbi:MAG: threonine/serine exporter family protein [Ruminococcaceae bacterium]|nr:threonine/serine exporter family protein [Oscillospiraceae bacterium]